MKVGGPDCAWVPNRIRGCLPPRTGCGWAATIRPRKAFSLPVEIRFSQLPSASSIAGCSRSTCRPVLRGDVDPGRPGELDQIPLDLPVQVAAALLVGQVPLVEGDQQGPPGLLHRGEDAQVLLGDGFAGVDHHHAHLGPLDGPVGAQAGVVLVSRRLLHPAPDAGRVDEAVDGAVDLDQLVDRVDGGAGRRCRPPRAAVRPACSADSTCRRSACRRWRPGAARRPPRRSRAGPSAATRGWRPACRRSRARAGRRPRTAPPARDSTSWRPRPRSAGRPPC